MALSNTVRALRELHGWTQQELAEKIGLSQSAVAHLENGKYQSPRQKTLAGLAIAFGMTIDELLRFANSPDEAIALPDPLYELQIEGLPAWVLKDLARMWPDLTRDDQQAILDLTRTIWERRIRGRTQKQEHAQSIPES